MFTQRAFSLPANLHIVTCPISSLSAFSVPLAHGGCCKQAPFLVCGTARRIGACACTSFYRTTMCPCCFTPRTGTSITLTSVHAVQLRLSLFTKTLSEVGEDRLAMAPRTDKLQYLGNVSTFRTLYEGIRGREIKRLTLSWQHVLLEHVGFYLEPPSLFPAFPLTSAD